ncbi:hypothetical protein [Agarivorans sp. 1_MG-2023]|uniref:hypothetical protein n=1 Tax=Agarivorans sp. 1_MG-2023 TaxID=3062634 RepID=UPI0026E2840F|nr:hypothetical protein [Agarivorans sp. 1_MG-2023]MDO6763208.1 hypothetical protein [Agarivorans sp. 1_MG-2023]
MDIVKKNFLPALFQAFLLCIVRVFTIPFQIWIGALKRLSELRSNESSNEADDTEFPVLNWFKNGWDGVIFLSWLLTIIAFLFTFIGGMFSDGYYREAQIGAAFSTLFAGYFAPIGLSLFKEGLTLVLSMALNLEKLVKKNSAESEQD